MCQFLPSFMSSLKFFIFDGDERSQVRGGTFEGVQRGLHVTLIIGNICAHRV